MSQVACGDAHSMCCGAYGKAFAWGQSRWGQTGTGSCEDVLTPLMIEELKDEYIVQVACGSRHSMTLSRSGAVFSFGNGEMGQLGHDMVMEMSTVPTLITNLPSYPVICIMASE